MSLKAMSFVVAAHEVEQNEPTHKQQQAYRNDVLCWCFIYTVFRVSNRLLATCVFFEQIRENAKSRNIV